MGRLEALTDCCNALADKGTPPARPVRKAPGLSEMAWLPAQGIADACETFTLNPLRRTFMQANRLIPIAVLAFAVACSDDATSPTSLTSAAGPLALQVAPG